MFLAPQFAIGETSSNEFCEAVVGFIVDTRIKHSQILLGCSSGFHLLPTKEEKRQNSVQWNSVEITAGCGSYPTIQLRREKRQREYVENTVAYFRNIFVLNESILIRSQSCVKMSTCLCSHRTQEEKSKMHVFAQSPS